MVKKRQGTKSRQKIAAPEDSRQKLAGNPYSLRSQRDVKEQWRLESELKTCRAQINYWERRLTKAQEGKTRQTAQISAGHGYAHVVLADYIKEIGEAERMISAFNEQAATLQAQIDALMPDAAKAAERAEGRRILAGQVRARLELDRRLDFALEAVRGILTERAGLTSKMREGAASLEFNPSLNLDDERFEGLLRILPGKMAGESQKFVRWFLGEDGERKPYTVRNDDVVLDETLRSCNAFRDGDCPNLTKEEIARIDGMVASRGTFAPQPAPETRRLGEPVPEVPASRIQWGLMR